MQALPTTERRKIEARKRAYFDLVRGRLRALQASGRLHHVDPTVAYHDRMHVTDGAGIAAAVIDAWPVDLRGWDVPT